MMQESGDYKMLTGATDKGYVGVIGWSSDGARIYYDRFTDVPRGIYSVSVLGGAEQLVLEDAGMPQALPDDSLLVGRYNSEGQYQVFRFWPQTGRLQSFPVELATAASMGPSYCPIPGRKEALVTGTLIGSGREAGRQLYLIDLDSGKTRRLLAPAQRDTTVFATSRDGKSVIASIAAANLERIFAIPLDGKAMVPIPITLTGSDYNLDVGPDGSIYVDQIQRPAELLQFDPRGGRAERISALGNFEGPGVPGYDNEVFAVLPDGRAVVTEGIRGRLQLMLIEPGKAPAPLANTTEETTAPVTADGPGQVAFLIGPEPRRTIAVAAVVNGRIVRRIAFDKGKITSLAASPDGQTLYCAAAGSIWSIPVARNDAKRLCAGDHLAIDPSGEYLVVKRTATPNIRLVRVPLDGSPEREIRLAGNLRPTYLLAPNGIDRRGRIVMPLGAFTWYWPAGIFDPATGRFSIIPLDRTLDFHALGWAPNGKIMALGLDWSSTMWRFHPQTTRQQ